MSRREREIVAALSTESLTSRRRFDLIVELRGIATEESVSALRDSLESPDRKIHVSALLRLAEIGSDEAIDCVIGSLLATDETAASWAARLLGDKEVRRAIPALVCALGVHSAELGRSRRFGIICALGRMPHRESVGVLALALRDPDRRSRRQAAWALQQIRATESTEALRSAVEELSWFRGRWARRALRARRRMEYD